MAALTGIALGLGIVLLATGLGIGWLRRFALSPLERLAYGGALGLAAVSYGVALFASLHWLMGLWGLLVIVVAGGLWGWRISWRSLRGGWTHRSWLNALGWGVSGLILLLTLILCALPPDGNEWDSLAYHLAYPKLYLKAGGMVEVPFMHQSYFPPLMDMLFLLGLWLHGESCAKVFHWAVALLTALGIAGFSPSRGGMMALLWLGTPVVAWQAHTAYVDLSTALYTGLGAFALYRGVREQSTAWLWLAGVMVGCALATKYTALLSWGLLGLIGLAWSLRARWGQGARTLLLAGLLALMIGAPWYLRNWLWTDNPVYPFAYEIFGGRQWSQAQAEAYRHDQLRFGMGRELHALLLSPWDLTALPAPFADPIGAPIGERVYLLPTAGMGYLATLGVYVAGGVGGGLGWLLIFALGNLVGWFFLMQQIRYLIPVFPVLTGVGGVALERAGRLVQYTYGGVLILQGGFTLWLLSAAYLTDLPLALQDRDAYLTRRVQIYPAIQYLNQHAPPNAGVILLDETRGYYLERPYLWGNAGHHRLIPYETMHQPEALIRWMREHGYRYVLINRRFTPQGEPEAWRRLYEQAIAEGLLVPCFLERGVEVYTLSQDG